jgi:hypothetical protein
VVDDCSTDGTAATARAHGGRVIAGAEPPPGWVGKLQDVGGSGRVPLITSDRGPWCCGTETAPAAHRPDDAFISSSGVAHRRIEA